MMLERREAARGCASIGAAAAVSPPLERLHLAANRRDHHPPGHPPCADHPGKLQVSCRQRVRQWVPGKAWVFDDTIDHEARNDSDKLRVVLIFDIWHPQLTPPEREMITAVTAGLNAFTGTSAGFDL